MRKHWHFLLCSSFCLIWTWISIYNSKITSSFLALFAFSSVIIIEESNGRWIICGYRQVFVLYGWFFYLWPETFDFILTRVSHIRPHWGDKESLREGEGREGCASLTPPRNLEWTGFWHLLPPRSWFIFQVSQGDLSPPHKHNKCSFFLSWGNELGLLDLKHKLVGHPQGCHQFHRRLNSDISTLSLLQFTIYNSIFLLSCGSCGYICRWLLPL